MKDIKNVVGELVKLNAKKVTATFGSAKYKPMTSDFVYLYVAGDATVPYTDDTGVEQQSHQLSISFRQLMCYFPYNVVLNDIDGNICRDKPDTFQRLFKDCKITYYRHIEEIGENTNLYTDKVFTKVKANEQTYITDIKFSNAGMTAAKELLSARDNKAAEVMGIAIAKSSNPLAMFQALMYGNKGAALTRSRKKSEEDDDSDDE